MKKEGQIILEEYPLLTLRVRISLCEFKTNHFPNIGEDIKAKILQFNGQTDNIRKLDTEALNLLRS